MMGDLRVLSIFETRIPRVGSAEAVRFCRSESCNCCSSSFLIAQSSQLTDSELATATADMGGDADTASNSNAKSDNSNDAAKATEAALPDEPSAESSSQNNLIPTKPAQYSLTPTGKFDLKGAFWQSFGVIVFFEGWRAAFDPGLRWNLVHKPFFYDWWASYPTYNMHRWGDGDDFVVNDVGHPLEGGVFGRVYLQNDPKSNVVIGKHRAYWMSRLKALGWAAAWSTESEIGPISETNIGNQGGFTYVPGCGTYLFCLNNPKYPKPPTNNTGWTDFVVTPLVGMAWVLGEDTIDKYIVSPIAVNHRIIGGRILRSALEPTRSFAAIFRGQVSVGFAFAGIEFHGEHSVAFSEVVWRLGAACGGTLGDWRAVQQYEPAGAEQHVRGAGVPQEFVGTGRHL